MKTSKVHVLTVKELKKILNEFSDFQSIHFITGAITEVMVLSVYEDEKNKAVYVELGQD